jgi:hypothetical protein
MMEDKMKRISVIIGLVFLTASLAQAEVVFNYWKTRFRQKMFQVGLNGIYGSAIANGTYSDYSYENGGGIQNTFEKTENFSVPVSSFVGGLSLGVNLTHSIEIVGEMYFINANELFTGTSGSTVESNIINSKGEREKFTVSGISTYALGSVVFKYPLLLAYKNDRLLYEIMPTIAIGYQNGFDKDSWGSCWLSGGLNINLGESFFVRGMLLFPLFGDVGKPSVVNQNAYSYPIYSSEFQNVYSVSIRLGFKFNAGGNAGIWYEKVYYPDGSVRYFDKDGNEMEPPGRETEKCWF